MLILLIFVGIQTKMLLILSLVPLLKKRFNKLNKLINWRSQTNRDQKSNLLFLQRYDQSQKL